MRGSILSKVLDYMFYFCKNKTLSLTFYEGQGGRVAAKTRKEFDSNLPQVYYVAHISSSNRELHAMQLNPDGDDIIIYKDKNFNSHDIATGGGEYCVHEYRESSPFSKFSSTLDETGAYRTLSECLKIEASLYISLFKLMGDSLSLILKGDSKCYLAYYLDGKVFIVLVSDWSINIKQTDFYALQKEIPNYEVIDFVALPFNISIKKFLERMQVISRAGNLELVKEG